MLMPKKTKFRKKMRGRLAGVANSGNVVQFGSLGLQATSCGYITARQIEAARRTITRKLRRGGKIWIRIFPDKPITNRPAETRMGKGKGSVEAWVSVIKPGRILYEVDGIEAEIAEDALRSAGFKLPVQTQIMKRGLIA